MPPVTIDLGGALDALDRLEERTADLSPLTATLAETLLAGVQRNFARREGPDGTPWAPLKKSTRKTYRREGISPLVATLRRTQGGLYSSLQAFSDDAQAGVSANKPYALIHQYGGEPSMPPGPAAIEARPYMYLDQRALDDVEEAVGDFLTGEDQ
jgi:phage virion morphogenesis protein